MNEVKLYQHIGNLVESTPEMHALYPTATRYVMAADYDALAAELERELTPHRIAAGRALFAPAAVVVPARMTTIPEGKTISYAAGYEDALDAVASLNRNTVPLELLDGILQYCDQLLGELNGMYQYSGSTGDDKQHHDSDYRELRTILAGAKA